MASMIGWGTALGTACIAGYNYFCPAVKKNEAESSLTGRAVLIEGAQLAVGALTVAIAGLFAYKVLPYILDASGPRVTFEFVKNNNKIDLVRRAAPWAELFPHHNLEKGFLVFSQIMLGIPLYFIMKERFTSP